MRRTWKPAFSNSSFTSAASARLYCSSGVPLAAMTPGFSGKWPASTAMSGPAIDTPDAAQTISKLEARKIGPALLEEGAHRFLRLGRAEALAEDARFFGDLPVYGRRVGRFHEALGEPDRFRRQLGELARRLFRRGDELVVAHDGGDDADLARLLGAKRLAEEEQLRGALVAGEERKQIRRAEFRDDAKRHERQLEA